MAHPSKPAPGRTTRLSGRGWMPAMWVAAIAVALAFMVGAPFVASRESASRRDRLETEVEPYDNALVAYHLDALRMGAEARSYAATRNPEARARFFAISARVDFQEQPLRDAADAAGHADDAETVIASARTYEAIALAIIAAEDAEDDFESFRLIEEEGEPGLDALDRELTQARGAVAADRGQIREDIRNLDRNARVALALAGSAAAIAVAALAWLVFNNIRLSQRVVREQVRVNNIVSDVPGVVWEAWGRPDVATQRIDFVSPYVEEMLGYTVEEWLKIPNFWLTIVHPDDRERAGNESAAIFASGQRGTNRFRWLAKDGRILWVEAHSMAVVDARGAPLGMRGVTLDITPRVRAEQALERERARFASIIASTDYGVYQCDADGRLEYMNPAAEEMLGYRTEEVHGRETHPIFHQLASDGTPLPLEECPLFRASRETTSYRGMELFSSRDGRLFPVEVACSPVTVDDRSTGAVIVFQDITARLRQERLKDDFVAFASHELRNPLTSLKGFSMWLQSRVQKSPGPFDPESLQAIDALVEDAARMESIIDLFLDLARIESNRLILDVEPVDARQLLEDECERLGQRHPSANCDIDTASVTKGPMSALVLTDENRLRQVLGNLLDNAAKYGGDPASVRVTLSVTDGWATIRVRDNGPGIPLADQPFVFDRYYRGRDALASKRKGLGVGLFISKQLVDRLGGTLTFTSTPGQGTEFVVGLPLVDLDVEGMFDRIADEGLPAG